MKLFEVNFKIKIFFVAVWWIRRFTPYIDALSVESRSLSFWSSEKHRKADFRSAYVWQEVFLNMV